MQLQTFTSFITIFLFQRKNLKLLSAQLVELVWVFEVGETLYVSILHFGCRIVSWKCSLTRWYIFKRLSHKYCIFLLMISWHLWNSSYAILLHWVILWDCCDKIQCSTICLIYVNRKSWTLFNVFIYSHSDWLSSIMKAFI